jgi:N-acetylglucosamine repressor
MDKNNRPLPPPRKKSRVVPTLLRQMNVRRVLDALRRLGTVSRADLSRVTGISPPTMSKLVEELLLSGVIEAEPEMRYATGRPSVLYRLGSRSAQILGAVIGMRECAVVASGLDGELDARRCRTFATPDTYEGFLRVLAAELTALAKLFKAPALGVGLSLPGLIKSAAGEMVLSPNIHYLDGRCPGSDLAKLLKLPVVPVQEEHGLCLAEQMFGVARGVEHFAMLDISDGLGMGVISGGRLISGSDGFGGEIGHMTAKLGGELCGCGNRGCLETVATDFAFMRALTRREGRTMTMDEIIRGTQAGRLVIEPELGEVLDYLAAGIGAIINVFNPAMLFVYGRLFEVRDGIFDQLVRKVGEHALRPSLQRCKIVRAQGNKRLGAIAAIINSHFNTLGPALLA